MAWPIARHFEEVPNHFGEGSAFSRAMMMMMMMVMMVMMVMMMMMMMMMMMAAHD